jgi:hypothetical protein
MKRGAGTHAFQRGRGMLAFVSPSSGAEDTTTAYEILVRGEVDEAFASLLGARRVQPSRGKTLILVDVIDQAHLHGILESLRDRAIDIERVNPV